MRIVNRAAELIATGRCGLDLLARVRLAALKVYCDEGYHALYSLDIANQVATATGIPIPPCDYGGLVGQVINEVPNDSSVVSTIREITRDHARDEGRHHRFFG